LFVTTIYVCFVLKDLLDEEIGHTTILEKQIAKYKQQNNSVDHLQPLEKPDIRLSESSQSSGMSSSPESDQALARESALKRQISELQQELDKAHEELRYSHDELILLEEEKNSRIDALQEQLAAMEENELKLNETVLDLEEIEKQLKQKMEKYESDGEKPEDLVKNLVESEKKLEGQVQQMADYQQELIQKIQDYEKQLEEYKPVKKELVDKQLNSVNEQIKGVNIEDSEQNMQDIVAKLTIQGEQMSKEIYELKLENKELQEHIDQLIDERDESSNEPTPLDRSKDSVKDNVAERMKELENEIENLKDQLLQAKLDAIKTLKDSEEFPDASLEDMNSRLKDFEHKEAEMNETLKEFEDKNKKLSEENTILKSQNVDRLTDTIEVLKDAEFRLLDKVEVLEDENSQLRDQVARLSVKVVDSQGSTEELQVKIGHMRKREQGLLQVIETLKEKQSEEQGKKSPQQDSEEMMKLKEKVDILMDSESKLMDKLEERAELVENLKEQVDKYRETAHLYEMEKIETTEKLKRLNILEEMQKDHVKLQKIAQERIEELEASEKSLQDQLEQVQIKGDECSSSGDEAELTSLKKQVIDLEQVLEKYETRIQQNQSEQKQLLEQLNEADDNEKHLQIQINQLQQQINELTEKNVLLEKHLHKMDASLPLTLDELTSEPELIKESSQTGLYSKPKELPSSQTKTTDAQSEPKEVVSKHDDKNSSNQKQMNTQCDDGSHQVVEIPSLQQDTETLRTFSPLDVAAMESLPHDELVIKLQELQEVENFHRIKIREMTEHLNCFRKAMEIVALSLEKDAEIPILKMKPKSSLTDSEQRIDDLVKAEVTLKLKVLELEKRESLLK
jgi:chromosome segregation ATPase